MDHSNIRYTKIKYQSGRVILEYQDNNGEEINKFGMNLHEEPLDTFKFALRELEDEVLNICEIPDPGEELENRIIITSVKIKYETKKEIIGIVIVFLINRKERSGYIEIKTPYAVMEAITNKPELDILGESISEKIIKLIEEADKYRLGKRKQIKLVYEAEVATK